MVPSLTRYAGVAIVASAAVIGLKLAAWWLTGSAGLLSDAVESVANLAGAIMAWLMLALASRPPDDEHAYGHSKAEYFSTGFEGALVLIAALGVGWVGVSRLLDPRPLESVGLGLAIAALASLLNLGVARLLLRGGREHGSIALESGGRHLMADVWTTVGVLVGVAVVALTGWHWMDGLIALAVAIHILLTGVELVRRASLGLLDTALTEEEVAPIRAILDTRAGEGVRYHALRTRRAGRRSFISVHLLVPGEWTVQRGHDVAEEVEEAIRTSIPGSSVFTHLEPVEDPVSFHDEIFR